jgi:hypothetical protein
MPQHDLQLLSAFEIALERCWLIAHVNSRSSYQPGKRTVGDFYLGLRLDAGEALSSRERERAFAVGLHEGSDSVSVDLCEFCAFLPFYGS